MAKREAVGDRVPHVLSSPPKLQMSSEFNTVYRTVAEKWPHFLFGDFSVTLVCVFLRNI